MKPVILIPTFNEKNNVERLIPLIFKEKQNALVMVVDDNSPDGTAQAVINLQTNFTNLKLYKREKKEGLGRAYMDSFRKVLREIPDATHLITMDADLSHDPVYIKDIIKAGENYDYVIGSRYIKGGSIVGWELWRKFLSKAGNMYCRMVTKMPIRDCTSGFACINTNLIKKMDFSDFDTSGYAFLMYLKYKAWRYGAAMYEIPICFRNRVTGESKISMSIIQEGLLLPWMLIHKQDKTHYVQCPICQKHRAVFWFTKNNSRVHKCQNCKLIFVHPIPSSLDSIYSQDYFCGAHEGFGYVNYDQEKEVDEETFSKYLKHINNYTTGKGKLLDVGAATGEFVRAAKESGWEAEGIEISSFAAEQGREKGLTMHVGILEDLDVGNDNYDVITMFDVFEHVEDPERTLKKLYNLLKPEGLLVINTPNAGSTHARFRQKSWPLIIPPEHLHLFDKNNLFTLLSNNHFKPLLYTSVGKKFQPAYILQILYTNKHWKPWKKMSDWIRKTPLNKIAIPINLRDNMFIIAKKKPYEYAYGPSKKLQELD